MMKKRSALICLIFAISMVTACDDDSIEADDEEPEEQGTEQTDDEGPSVIYGEMGVVLKSQGSGILKANQSRDHNIEFCYQDVGCDDPDASTVAGASIGGEGAEIVLHSSDPDRAVVGVRVGFETSGDGSALVEVGEGTLIVDDEGFVPSEDFEFDNILETSEVFSGGEVISFEVGYTN